MKQQITQSRLKALLNYDMETGVFTWLVNRGKARIGCKAGGISPRDDGLRIYISIGMDGKQYLAHRLAWLFVYGDFPEKDIDHKDCDGTNNRWNNLRLATQTQNNANTRTHAKSITGIKGVRLQKRTGRYEAQIQSEGKLKYLGTFDTPDEAKNAYFNAAKECFGEYARAAA
jgi:hypothetical protein